MKLLFRAAAVAVAISGPAVGMALYRGDGVGPILGGIAIVAGTLFTAFVLARAAVAASRALGWTRLAAAMNRPWREALGVRASESRAD